MAKLYDLARMTTATVGTGTITLGVAVPGYLTFALAGISNLDVIDYAIFDYSKNASEIGTGTYTTAGTTLTRTVTKSTNGNAALVLSGNSQVFISPRAETLNAAGLPYIATGTGGTSQFIADRLQRTLWATDYGAVCNGIADDTTALQNMINEAITLNAPARFAGQCKITSSLSITNTVDFGGVQLSAKGDNPAFVGGSQLAPSTTLFDAISVSTENPVNLHDFSIAYPSPSATNSGIVLTAPGGAVNFNTRINNVAFYYANIGIKTIIAGIWDISRCYFYSCNIGIQVQNTVNADTGDSTISRCVMTMAQSPGVVGISYLSSGGLRVCNNKLNGGQYGFFMNLDSGANTGDLLFTGNSVESYTTSAMAFARAGATGSFTLVTIIGNEFPTQSVIQVPFDTNGVWLNNIVFTGNVCQANAANSSNMIDIDTVSGFTCVGNIFRNIASSGNVFKIGSSVSYVTLGNNGVYGTFADDSIYLPSASLDRNDPFLLTISNGANTAITSGDAVIYVWEPHTGDLAIFQAAVGNVTLTSSMFGTWVIGTAPAAGHASVGYNAGTGTFDIYNNLVAGNTFFKIKIMKLF
jgi:hypothetical protein